MPKYKNNYELLEAINKHLKNSGDPGIDLKDFNLFYYGEVDKNVRNLHSPQDTKKIEGIYDKLTNLMVLNHEASKDLKDELPEIIHKDKSDYLKKLREQAARTADAHAKKAEANQINAERKAAKLQLERIRKEREKARLRAAGKTNVTDKDVELKPMKGGISSARGKHIFTSLMNYFFSGPRDERRENVDYPVDAEKEIFTPVECGSPEEGVILKGGMYRHKTVPSNGKTVLVFTGSEGPGANEIDSIKGAYLAQGYTVYQYDYRCYGKSHQVDKKGKPVSSSKTEQAMYKDGMVMYNHLVKNLKIDPKDLVLHGFSLGAPIASRVALEATKELQTNIHENARKYNPEKHGIGGIVLHSPMRTMFKSARYEYNWAAAAVAKHHAGNYDTVQHMTDLAKIDPNVRVHLISGDPDPKSANFDNLAHQFTKIDKALKGKFNSMTEYNGISDHSGEYGGRPKPNVSINDPDLKAMAKGRVVKVKVKDAAPVL